MPLLNMCQWIEDTALGVSIRESTWTFPILVAVHILSLMVFLGPIMILDLRLLGLGIKRVPVNEVAGQLLRLAAAGFAFTVASGILLWLSEAVKCYQSGFFRLKMLFLLLAGLNALLFHLGVYRRIGAWGQNVNVPARARVTGVCSILFWIGAVVAGRAVGYNLKL